MWYLDSHVLEVVASPTHHLAEAENGAVQIVLSVEGAFLEVGVISRFKDIGPRR